MGSKEQLVDAVASRKRCLDRRRETSRFAARDRRGKEADVFLDLKDVVPIVDESTTATHVDRIALLRVAATLCRMRKNAAKFLHPNRSIDESGNEIFIEPEKNIVGDSKVWLEDRLTECLDGFIIIADVDGTILYVTESVSVFLGLTQTDLVGRHLKEFVYLNDYDELARAIINAEIGNENECDLEIVLRMKSIISPRGRNLNLKSALYKAIMCRCRFIANVGSADMGRFTEKSYNGKLTLIYGCSTPAGQGTMMNSTGSSSLKGNEATCDVFTTRHTCDMRFTYISENLNFLLRRDTRSLMGSSFYELVHPADLKLLTNSIKELFRKGHCRTHFYRLLGTNGSVVWTQTEAATVNHTTRGQKGQYVLCVHSMIGTQNEDESWSIFEPIEESQVIEPLKDGNEISAALPVKNSVKMEIPDVAEYFGRQPEFVDCVDFTPLIEPIRTSTLMTVDLNDYQPATRSTRLEPQICPTNNKTVSDELSSSYVEHPKLTRHNSFDEVLQWLFQDEECEMSSQLATSTEDDPLKETCTNQIENNVTFSIGDQQFNQQQLQQQCYTTNNKSNNKEMPDCNKESRIGTTQLNRNNVQGSTSVGTTRSILLAALNSSSVTTGTPTRFSSAPRNERFLIESRANQQQQQQQQYSIDRAGNGVLFKNGAGTTSNNKKVSRVGDENCNHNSFTKTDMGQLQYESVQSDRRANNIVDSFSGIYSTATPNDTAAWPTTTSTTIDDQYTQIDQSLQRSNHRISAERKSQSVDNRCNRMYEGNKCCVSTISEPVAYTLSSNQRVEPNLHTFVPTSNCAEFAPAPKWKQQLKPFLTQFSALGRQSSQSNLLHHHHNQCNNTDQYQSQQYHVISRPTQHPQQEPEPQIQPQRQQKVYNVTPGNINETKCRNRNYSERRPISSASPLSLAVHQSTTTNATATMLIDASSKLKNNCEKNIINHNFNRNALTSMQDTTAGVIEDYHECEQLDAQLAPFLPQDEMLELFDESVPSIEEVNELFSDFDPTEYYPATCSEILPEIGFSSGISAGKAVNIDEIYYADQQQQQEQQQEQNQMKNMTFANSNISVKRARLSNKLNFSNLNFENCFDDFYSGKCL